MSKVSGKEQESKSAVRSNIICESQMACGEEGIPEWHVSTKKITATITKLLWDSGVAHKIPNFINRYS